MPYNIQASRNKMTTAILRRSKVPKKQEEKRGDARHSWKRTSRTELIPQGNPNIYQKTTKNAANRLQIHAWGPPGSPKTRKACPGPEKTKVGRLGTSKIMPKELQI